MKKLLARVLSLALCAAALCALPAFAAEERDEAPDYLSPVRVWGSLTKLDDGGLLVQNSDPNDPYNEIILHGESIRILDAVSGLPLDRELRDGEVIYAWVGPAMTMSLPPHATAQVIVANIPADAGAPQYYQIARVEPQTMTAIYPTPPLTHTELVTTDGKTITVTKDAELTPYLTRQMVTLESLVPGSRVLVWTDAEGAVTRVVLFAYEYQGYVAWESTGEVSVNDQRLSVTGKVVDGAVLLPIRSVAETAGYTVNWVPGQGAVVSNGDGSLVLSVLPGQTTARTATGERGLTGACYFENGTTYLPAGDVSHLLNLFQTY